MTCYSESYMGLRPTHRDEVDPSVILSAAKDLLFFALSEESCYREYAGGAFQHVQYAGAPALASWPVRGDVFHGDPTHARDRYSIGDGGDTPFYRLASSQRCTGDDRGGTAMALP